MATTNRLTILDLLPIELLRQILSYCSAPSVQALSHTSRGFNVLIDNRVWYRLCREEFRYWSSDHRFRHFSDQDIKSEDWRQVFLSRQRKEQETTRLLNGILQSQCGRINKYQQIVDLGYDTKDCLLKHLEACEDDADDWLARTLWYSDVVLGYLHRSMAVKEWAKIRRREEASLERALSAFDMFVLHDRSGDFEETRSQLDTMSRAVLADEPEFVSMTTRQKALVIAAYLRRHSLVGIRGLPEQTYHDLQNNFIGFGLHDPDHSFLPLQSAAIYCAIARRLGVQASPCAMPFHVYVIVQASGSGDLNDEIVQSDHQDQDEDRNPDQLDMYLDPFETDQEIEKSQLTSRLYSVGTPEEHHAAYFAPATIEELVLRSGRNIITSIQESYQNQPWLRGTRMGEYALPVDPQGAFYGALWSALMFSAPPADDVPRMTTLNRRAYFPPFIQHFETHYPMDASLIEEHILPTLQNAPESASVRQSVHVTRAADQRPKLVKARTKEIAGKVRFNVGQVFRHRRYDYEAVITGWDVECSAGEQWMERMRVTELQRGQYQSFYHVLVEDGSVRYVAEENIQIITPRKPLGLMRLAGRHFKRWDYNSRRFVSNIRDEYPDD